MSKWLHLIVGGIAGTCARYALSGAIYQLAGTEFPYGTLVVNLLGCGLIGLFAGLAEERLLLGPNARVLLMAGFCGAFTTFSTFMLETANLLKDGEVFQASVNVGASVVAGFIAFKLGLLVAELL